MNYKNKVFKELEDCIITSISNTKNKFTSINIAKRIISELFNYKGVIVPIEFFVNFTLYNNNNIVCVGSFTFSTNDYDSINIDNIIKETLSDEIMFTNIIVNTLTPIKFKINYK